MNNAIRLAAASVVTLASILSARADSVTYTGSGVNPASSGVLAAEAKFTIDAGKLTVDLWNTGAPAQVPSDALMAVMFTLPQNVTLTPLSASLQAGSEFTHTPGYSLGQEWQFRSGISGPEGITAGISAAGFGLFSAANFAADGQNLQGMDYGIVNGVSSSANKATKNATFVNNGASFVLNAPSLSLTDISNVHFQYGTDLSEPRIPGTPRDPHDPHDPNDPPSPPSVPEPSAVSLLACGALGASSLIRRRR